MHNLKFIFPLSLLFFSLAFISCAQKPKSQVNSGIDNTWMQKSDSFWKQKLSDDQYYVLREKGTEKPYSGKWLLHEDSGTYTCAACGNVLFNSNSKFESHCGWPSFDEEINGGKIKTKVDNSLGMQRIEIMCARCGGHLGHLFDDGPTSTGKRYCVNSLSLSFEKENKPLKTSDTLTLGGGCFWCIEAVFEQLKGVSKVESGFSGGKNENPSYAQVCTGSTGHVEVVQIIYNPTIISMDELLKAYFTVHDPTTLNRQGADEGTQYRSVIFYRNEEQKQIATSIISDLQMAKVYSSPLVTAIEPFTAFYKADISHQDYYANNKDNAYCQMVIQPKMEKFEKVFKDRLK
jgi:peptide methionine sulfoxide reductase msrA/msrB